MRWDDLARWVGPTVNRNAGGMSEYRGLVIHIAEGFYEGTISWQRNPDSNVSSHFVVDRDGTIAQVVDTADTAWTQRAGNGHWLSVECAGFTLNHPLHATHPGWEALSDEQMTAIAGLLVRASSLHGVPLALATSSGGRGLGHHSMGGVTWGHLDCPGPAIIAQKPEIIRRAKLLAAGGTVTSPIDQAAGLMTKLIFDLWSPTKAEYVAAGGSPTTYDLLAGAGSATNKLAVALRFATEAEWVQVGGDPAVYQALTAPGALGKLAQAVGRLESAKLTPTEAQWQQLKELLAQELAGWRGSVQEQLDAIHTRLATLNAQLEAAGLTDADRELLGVTRDAVQALNNRLASP